jgi:hypothetical protein
MVMVSSVISRLVECVLQVEVAADGVAVASMCVHTHARIYADVDLQVHICERALCICMYMYMCMCMYIYVYTYVYM